MSEEVKLNKPWLVAVWPGMGQVAGSAGYYLMAKLGMHLLTELSPQGLFDIDAVAVKDGVYQRAGLPRNRLFAWKDPREQHDIVVFIGEAQPPVGKYAFCQKLIEQAQQLGIERVFTFAAMATAMHPEHESRVFAAATDESCLKELQAFPVEILESGQIGGLNGVLIAAAAESGLRGYTLLGEMPHIFAQLPFPKAALAILKVFTNFAGIEIDLTELEEQARLMDRKLGELLARVEDSLSGQRQQPEEEEFGAIEEQPEKRLSPRDQQHLEDLFEVARHDRSRAYELKHELDRLGVFADYEDRFLDLFKKPD
ncbi:MAG: PAC2 family protein [Planctomycetia bacterium]|nr:PAC2 family protein [Planctomycetia bacterium]